MNSEQSSTVTRRVIAVVGAGFSGVAVVTRLLCQHDSMPLDIVLINASGKRARGVAYGTESSSHLLNVPAGRMSIWPEKPDDFLNFLQLTDPNTSGHDFVPRSRYGDYLEHVLENAQQNSPHRLVHQVAKVTDIVPSKLQHYKLQQFELQFANGGSLLADKVVLALGNFPPQNPHLVATNAADAAIAFGHQAYLRDPWSAAAQKALQTLPRNARVLLLGTGLSMLDVAMLLEGPTQQSVQIDAISRRGLLPQAHRDHIAGTQFATHDALIPPALRALATVGQQHSTTALSILRNLRAAIAVHAPGDWRDVIAAIRPITPALWRALPEIEQQRFIRHLAPYWDTHRHRAAPTPARTLKRAIASGRITVNASRIVALQALGTQLLVSTKARGSDAIQQQKYDLVINCTGPQNSLLHLQDTLIDAISQRGLAQKLHNGSGFAVAADLSLAVAGLHYVGPLLRANFWEATAVPELREHARTVAAALTL